MIPPGPGVHLTGWRPGPRSLLEIPMRLARASTELPRRALLLSGGILALSGVYFMIIPLLSLYMSARLHTSPSRIGIVLAVMAIANQGLQMFVGVLAGRWGVRSVLGWGIVIVCLGYLGFASTPPFSLQIASAFALGLGTAATSLLGKAMLADAAVEKRASAFALRAAAVNGGAAAGPVVGALLFGWFKITLLVTAAVYALFWLTLVRPAPASAVMAGGNRNLGQQTRELLGNRTLLGLAAASSGYWYLYTQLTFTFPLYANDRFGLGGKVGFLFGTEAVIAVVLQYPLISWLRRRIDSWRILYTGCLVLTAAFLILSVVPTVWALLLFVVAFALGAMLMGPTLDLLATEISPETAVAGALGVVSLGWALGGLLGNLIGGVLYEAAKGARSFGLFWAFDSFVAAVAAAVFVALGRRFRQRAAMRDLASAEPAAPPAG